ncbi:MAG: GTP-binding protein [Bacteroidetes bacterium]|nr:GTP-binding protein [Bacteroidota bacterium]
MKENLSLLRFTTAGSVDDGKSTLIGRLLYDSKSIFEDQLDHITESSRRRGKEEVDLSLLTDGLKAEREQGITIDVAYRYFATPRRKFIIADTPGHIQYTRNMVTGASTADMALILVDARNGVVEQTIRHTYIAHLLDIRYIVFCINKMDLTDYSNEVFSKLRADLKALAVKLEVPHPYFLPISAKLGDNVVDRSENMPWYEGPTLLELLETVEINGNGQAVPARFPVQYVIRPLSADYPDYRSYAGRVAGGSFRRGEKVVALPAGLGSTIKSIDTFNESHDTVAPGESVAIVLDDDIDISRGDMIVPADAVPELKSDIVARICWFSEKPMVLNGKYLLRHTGSEVRCVIREVIFRLNVNTVERDTVNKEVKMNDIARISIRTAKPLFTDPYIVNHTTGSFILIDEGTNNTVAAGMII